MPLLRSTVVIIHEKAYVGGKGLNNTGGGLVDFLVQNKLTQNVGLIEVKTPATHLLGSKYRDGCYSMSAHLSGNLRYVRIVTFDELFQKVATLLALLGEEEILPRPK